MKLYSSASALPLIIGILFTVIVAESMAGPRYPSNPRGIHDPRGAYDPRGVFDPRGPFDPRNPAPYMYGLPTGYSRHTFVGVNYYYCGGIYYYPFIINGQTVYTRCVIVKGVPVVPARPY